MNIYYCKLCNFIELTENLITESIMSLFGMFSNKDATNKIEEYLKKGAIILDVRTLPEWNEGHIRRI